MMNEQPTDAVNIEVPDAINLQRINAHYQVLADKYPLPIHNVEEALEPLPLQPIHIDSKSVNNDLKQLMALYDENLSIESHQAMTPTPAQIILTHPMLFNTLSLKNLTHLMLRNETAKTDSYNVLNQTDTYTKKSLQDCFVSLAIEQKQTKNKTLENNLTLINFLLSVPRHAALFTWQQILDIFKRQDNNDPLIPFKLAVKFENLCSGWKAFINQLTRDNAEPYLLAMKDLNEAELKILLPKEKDQQIFFNLLASPSLSIAIVNNWQPATIKWAISQICHLPAEQHTSIDDDEIESITFPKPLLLNNLLIGMFEKKPPLFLNQVKNAALLTHVRQDTLKTCLNLPTTPENKTTKSALLTTLISMKPFLSTLNAPLVLCLCKHSDTEQLQELLKNTNVKQQLATSKDGKHSAIYSLFSDPSDQTSSKAKWLQENPYDLLENLSAAEILDLASNPAYKVSLSQENVSSLLEKRSLNTLNSQDEQENLNQMMCSCKPTDEKTTLTKGLFNVVMKHDDYQEAWLRSEIFSAKWETLGQGFFCKKIPATIEKARKFLDADGKDTSPLSKDDLKTLINFFKTAKNTSHNYSYFWGSYNLRDEITQNFYNKVAELPEIDLPEANTQHNMM